MFSKKHTILALSFLMALQLFAGAQEKSSNSQEVPLTTKCLLYLPNRVADLFDIVQIGVAVGPSIGAEIALTEYAQAGAYVSQEKGLGYFGRAKGGEFNTFTHSGEYQSTVLGQEATRELHDSSDAEAHFSRSEYQLRAQLAFFLVHGYIGIDLEQTCDFFAGIVALDPMEDNINTVGYSSIDNYDTILGDSPSQRLGRGLSNFLTGLWEIPVNIKDVSNDRGPVAGVTYGAVRGVARALAREVAGVYEIVTFPKGGKTIITPEYPLEDTPDTTWTLNWDI